STGNRVLTLAIERSAENIKAGDSLAAPLGACKHFPRDVVEMVAVGEESNNLETVLMHIAEALEKRTSRQLELFVRLLEPAMLLVMAILVMLAGAAVPIYMRYLDEARRDRAKVDVKTIGQVVDTYILKYGEPPASLQVLCQPTPDGGRPYLEPDALKDPWGREYQ